MREDLHDCVPVNKIKTISPLLLVFVRVDQPNSNESYGTVPFIYFAENMIIQSEHRYKWDY